jgi:hypothetical protein
VADHAEWANWIWSVWPMLIFFRFAQVRRRRVRMEPRPDGHRQRRAQVAQQRRAEANELSNRWKTAKATHETTAREFAEFECDALAVLRLPDLVDSSVPATARFVEAFAESSALATDRQPPDEHAEKFIAASEAAERAWRAAWAAAERMRMGRFSPDEREALDRAIKLLTVAQESNHPGERRAAYDKAREQLAVLQRRSGWTLPNPAVAELEQQVSQELA